MKLEEITLDWLQARVVEIDGCWVWNGHISGDGKVPQVRIDYKCYSVNRIVWELVHAKPIPKDFRVGPKCMVPGCVHPDHLVARKPGALLVGKPLTTDRKMKIAIARRVNSAINADDVQAIKLDPRPAIELVEEYGVTHSHLCRIRRDETRKDYTNPFAGLTA